MLTQKCPDSLIVGQVRDERAGQKETSAGCSETEVNELHVTPTGEPALEKALITVIPVGRWPNTERSVAATSAAMTSLEAPPTNF